jgi:predicted DNA-binding transcriptional regulator AlpA
MDIVQKFGEDVAVPTNPESEGSRLITLKQIEQEHGIGRSSLHTYRRRPTFPQPVPVEGSTKLVYDAAEVAAWFEANPPQQGKRSDLAPRDEGAAMPQTTDQTTPNSVSPPDYLTRDQWAGLTLAVLGGAMEGVERAGLPGAWGSDLGVAAVKGLRDRLDVLIAEGGAQDG